MRLVAVVVGFLIWCGNAAAQSTPVRTGLWDSTIRTKATVPPAMAAAMKKNGLTATLGIPMQTIDPPVTVRVHTCMNDEAELRKKQEANTTGPAHKDCVYTHRSEDAHGLSAGLKCDVGGMVVVTEKKLSWVSREKIHVTVHSKITYPGVAGEGLESMEVTSVFLSPDCGSVAQGASVPVK
jgi:hypothetical protein